MFCANCGCRLDDEYTFCTNCGTLIQKEIIEIKPQKMPEETVRVEPDKIVEVKTQEVPKKAKKEKKNKRKSIFENELVGVFSIIAVFILFMVSISSGWLTGNTIYDRILFIGYGRRTDCKQVGSVWFKSETDPAVGYTTKELMDSSMENYITSGAEVDALFTLGDDGSLAYLDHENNIWQRDRYMVLYLKGKEVAEEVSAYAVSEKFNRIIYNQWGSLYQKGLMKPKLIAEHVKNFDVSDNGKRVVYLTYDDELYFWKNGKKSRLIDSDVSEIHGVVDDLNVIYYSKDGDLYKFVNGKTIEEVDFKGYEIIKIYDSGELYYTETETVEVELMDYVEDDVADTSYGERLRGQLEGTEATLTTRKLYYYDGEESTLVTDFISADTKIVGAKNAPVLDVQLYSKEEIIKLSEIPENTNVAEYIQWAINERTEHHVVCKDSIEFIPENTAEYVVINDSGSKMCFLDNIDYDEYLHDDLGNSYIAGDLYQVEISDDEVSEPELLDEEVEKGYGEFLSDDIYAYLKKHTGTQGTLCINGDEVEDNVFLDNISVCEETGTVYYYTDWVFDEYDLSKGAGTLKKYEDESCEKIYENVSSHEFTSRGELLFITYEIIDDGEVGRMYQDMDDEIKFITNAVEFVNGGEAIDDSERGFNYGW